MKTYRDLNGDSGVDAYDYSESWMQVRFRSEQTYEYLEARIGRSHLTAMKQLADAGHGLNAYINLHPEVKRGWSSKW